MVFVFVAMLLSRTLRTVVHAAMTRHGHIDRTTISFLQQFGSALIWVIMIILYAHLIPVLRSMGTALLAGASIASVVIGLAAQSTLGNLVAGISITIYRPFRLATPSRWRRRQGRRSGWSKCSLWVTPRCEPPMDVSSSFPTRWPQVKVSINLSSTYSPWPITIGIRVSRDADIEAAQKLAITVANETVGEKAVGGCFLTKVEATAAVLELRVQAPDAAGRDKVAGGSTGETVAAVL